ncbi:MAG: putative Ribonuclease [Candidatus Saccharibacteria bacterium]|nr:putative Ribonuclease [Candidatus Saccharibacteria bacterium]
MILGIDEVGRGPWAGPLVVGAVVLGGVEIEGLTDSKKLTKKRREALDIIIRESAAGIGLGWVHADEIDEVGLSMALKLATKRAVEQIIVPYHEIIIDGTINFLAETSKGRYVTTLAKADLLIPSVSAASIVAKVARDAYMAEQDVLFPGYGFKSHVGYGTAAHRAAIEQLGVTPLHRLSFAPLAKYKEKTSASIHARNGFAPGSIRALASDRTVAADVSVNEQAQKPTAKQIGDQAENEAVRYLEAAGHQILERNWKTKYCEIDIVSERGGTIFFTEAKYRRQPSQGGGLAAITPTKLRQMKFAARVYASYRKLSNTDMKLAAISLTGEPPIVETFLELEES